MTYRRWASLHRIVGLAFLLHWTLLALTGMTLVFHRDIEEELLGAGLDQARAVSLDALADRVTKAYPGSRLLQISTLNGGMELLRLRVKPADNTEVRSLVFDARSDAVVGDSPLSGSLRPDGAFQFIYRLHQTLLLGDSGKTLVALSGMFLVFTALAGFRLLWPQRRNWRRIVRPKLIGNPRTRMTLIHRAIGVIAGPFIFILAVTGAGMNWTPAIQSALAAVNLADVPSPLRPDTPVLLLGPDAALAKARARFPEARFTSIILPSSADVPYLVRLRQPREAHAIFGMTAVRVDGSNGAILSVADPRRSKAGDKMLEWLFAIHNGEFLGLPGRLLVLLTGAAIFLLCLLGGAAWVKTPRRAEPITKR